jgi:hypothetical protein
MTDKTLLTKIIAVAGTALAWFPILAPVLLTVAFLISTGTFRFDFLMPAELFLFAVAGGVLLIWAAWRAHAYLKLISWGLGSAVFFLVGGQVLAEVTGLASGEREPSGFWFILVLALLGFYILALIAMGVGGVLLSRDLFKKQNATQGEI